MSARRVTRRAALLAIAGTLAGAAALAHSPASTGTAVPADPVLPKDPLAGRFGGPFELTRHDGRRVHDTDFRGSFLLVYFGYTRCDDLCPLDLSVISRALDLLGPAATRIQPLFITVDPERDTPEALAAYVSGFSPRLVGLTGSEAEIAAVAKAYKVHRRKLKSDLGDQTAYIVDHGSLTFLMGPDGGFLTLLPHNTEPETMARVIGKYVKVG